ncbi:carcinoembryonic antigen-related cell adhesion molecule 6-like [Ochotona curzoniae]|uniref:carcinoembryonic antigen-related cell adhesion molecule 6-like n=1 Tax=Ochotona curzoniae TaxID=130825 RepID=UPI001B3514C4|nr:carcinoembryonic antigen-related cell adhesion molecule 6-like [Ochotona curzoniae]
MESPSASPHRGHVPWQGLLLAVSLLTVWIPSTMAEYIVEPVPPIAAEGMDVLLLLHSPPQNAEYYAWYKGETPDASLRIVTYTVQGSSVNKGPKYTDRYTIFPNGSLLIQNVIQDDTGNYTIGVIDDSFVPIYVTVQLHVYYTQLSSNDTQPIEGKESVVLTCEPDIPGMTYQWYKDGKELQEIPDRLQLSSNNRILTLLNVTREDVGIYECEISNSMTVIFKNSLTLNISYGPDTPTISPPEENYCSGTNLSFLCDTDSYPPAQYTWLINGQIWESTQQLHILNISLSDSGSYTCKAYNSITDVSNITVKNITVHETVAQPSIQVNNTTVTEKDILVLTCLTAEPVISTHWIFNSQSLQLTERTRLSLDNSTLTIDPVMMEDEGEYQCEVIMGCSSKSDPVRIAVRAMDTENTHLLPGAIAGIVIGAFVAVILLCILAYFLYCSKTRRDRSRATFTTTTTSPNSLPPPVLRNHKVSGQDQSDTSPAEIHEVAYSSLNFHVLQPKQSTPASLSPGATDTVYSEVRKK